MTRKQTKKKPQNYTPQLNFLVVISGRNEFNEEIQTKKLISKNSSGFSVILDYFKAISLTDFRSEQPMDPWTKSP